jgi:hypothetical protein
VQPEVTRFVVLPFGLAIFAVVDAEDMINMVSGGIGST